MKTCACFISAILMSALLYAQNPPPVESVGNPTLPTPVASYTGWDNQGLVNYSGTAEVQAENPSDCLYASGQGNVYFTNQLGTYFQIMDLPADPYNPPDAFYLEFNMYGYDIAHPDELNDLLIYSSTDSGSTWVQMTYQRFWHLVPWFRPPIPWDVFTAIPNNLAPPFNVRKLAFKFVQNSAAKTFRIDDIRINYLVLLPLRLKYFSANMHNRKVVLNWNAHSNSSREYFIVEKSENGRDFSAIGKQFSKGQGENDYEFTDAGNSENMYYRLRLVNVNDKSSLSNILRVGPEMPAGEWISAVYPVPVKDILKVDLVQPAGANTTLTITDATGKVRLLQSLFLKKGFNHLEMDVKNLASGTYFLTAKNTGNKQTKKLLVIK